MEQLLDSGFFDGQRFELIDGELLDKMGQKPPHAATIQNLTEILIGIFGALVRVQLPMEAGGADRDRSLPEPDFAVVRERKPEHRHRHPRGDELLLAVEVSDTSLAIDMRRKAEIYANAGIPEYWVVDLTRRLVVRMGDPRGGLYRVVQSFSPGESVPIADRPEGVPVDDILSAAP